MDQEKNRLARGRFRAGEIQTSVVLNEQQYKTLLAKWKRFKKQKRAWKSRDFQNNTLKFLKHHAKKVSIVTTKSLSIQVLRKSCITNWANRIQNPKAIRKLAGHSDIATTMKYYSMLTNDVKAKAAAVIDEILSPVDVKMKITINRTMQVSIYKSKRLRHYPRKDSNLQPLAPEANALSN